MLDDARNVPCNRLIEALPARQRMRLLRECTSVHLQIGEVLATLGQPIAQIHFPLLCFVSLQVEVEDHPPVQAGLIGSEGMLGATVLLGADRFAVRAVVLGSGSALRVDVVSFRQALESLPDLPRVLKRYLAATLNQLAQTAACMRFHETVPRLARCLLAIQDRAHGEPLQLTHQNLADLLGVQRSAVTIAAGVLQRRHLIRYSRGQIRIVDRVGLEAASCECYWRSLEPDLRGACGPD